MKKSLVDLWIKSFTRANRAQQVKNRKVFKGLLVKSLRAPKRTAGKAANAHKSVKLLSGTKPRSSASPAPKQAIPAFSYLPGTWRKSVFTSPAEGLVPAKRLIYWLYLPSGDISTKPRPMVVMLHGCKQSATDLAASTRMNQLAERKGFAVLYPQQSLAADAHRCWHWYKRATQKGGGDVKVIAAMIRHVQEKHLLDTSRTYVAGLSAGAGLAAILALRHPELIAAVGLHSAPVHGTSDSPMAGFKAMQQGSATAYLAAANEFCAGEPGFPGMPVVLIHGKSDPVVRRVNMDQLTAQFAIIDAPFITSDQPVLRHYPGRIGGRCPRHAYSTSTYYAGRRPELMSCEIDSLGHAWSGGDGSVAFSSPAGPDATLLMWSFFSRQRRVKVLAPLDVSLR
jgi:poly(hydroxyalkanoate) depolymerase family esterase